MPKLNAERRTPNAKKPPLGSLVLGKERHNFSCCKHQGGAFRGLLRSGWLEARSIRRKGLNSTSKNQLHPNLPYPFNPQQVSYA